MRMKSIYHRLLLCCLLLCVTVLPLTAQMYKYVGVEQGLNSRRIFKIMSDTVGYMWFLNNEGVDRWDGRAIKHYEMSEPNNPTHITSYTGWLFTGLQGEPLVVGCRGRIFRYDIKKDCFEMQYRVPGENVEISYCCQDNLENIWLCTQHNLTLYNLRTGSVLSFSNPLSGSIAAVAQVDDNLYLVATNLGIHYVRFQGGTIKFSTLDIMEQLGSSVTAFYYHRDTRRLHIGTNSHGVFLYDFNQQELTHVCEHLKDTKINQIIPFDAKQLLLATEGRGIHRMNRETGDSEIYIVPNFEQHNMLSGNNIADIYVDDKQRVWLADYPIGVTIVDKSRKNYYWFRHSSGNPQSLVNDHVHCVMQDSDGDLWFGTSNGISLCQVKTGRWHSFLSTSPEAIARGEHIRLFATLCEVQPGIICAGAYSSGIYRIDKRTLTAQYYSSYLYEVNPGLQEDRYIRKLVKASDGTIWAGGLQGLKSFDPVTHQISSYSGLANVTSITEKDSLHLWVGTSTGLRLLDRTDGRLQPVHLTSESICINTLYQTPDGILYIGTDGAGLLVYDHRSNSFDAYHKDNSALVTNHIYTILPHRDGSLLLGTENGLSRFNLTDKSFSNWTKEQGLMSACLNGTDAVMLADGSSVFGTPEGVVAFPADTPFPNDQPAPMIFTEFRIYDQRVTPGEPDSPLEQHINRTDLLRLEYDQNSFSLHISDINHESPGNLRYRWNLEGHSEDWNLLQKDEPLRIVNLSPGRYTLHIESFLKAEPYDCKERRSLHILIATPWWLTSWAIGAYILLPLLLLIGIFTFYSMHKEKRITDEKNRFFISTAHNLRTPITLVKAPLEELATKLDDTAAWSLHTALRNLNALQQLSTNLINLEQAELRTAKLKISEYELYSYLDSFCEPYREYARLRRLSFIFECDFEGRKVWFDKEKMDIIFQNILSNAIKYTPDGGRIILTAKLLDDNWNVTLSDSGIGIPSADLKQLFHLYFRGSNAVNSKITGSGIGLPLVRRLVLLHRGQIDIQSEEQMGTTVSVTFPLSRRRLPRHIEVEADTSTAPLPDSLLHTPVVQEIQENASSSRLLIVEDNDEMRAYLTRILSEKYTVRTCVNGKEALQSIENFNPELILADVMMPVMRGDDLCSAIKSNVNTSHIPVILLTALADEQDIYHGLSIGADEYIYKPFNINVLKAKIASILRNRELLRHKYVTLGLQELSVETAALVSEAENSSVTIAHELDVRFLTEVQKEVEKHLGNEKFTVDILCSAVGMSRTAFYNKLKALTDQAPADFIRSIRLKQAIRLLTEERITITEVAERTGFCDGKYFREVFKKHYGVSPSQYVKGERA